MDCHHHGPLPHGIKTSLHNLRGFSKSLPLFFLLTLTSYIHYRCGGDGADAVAMLPRYYFLSNRTSSVNPSARFTGFA